MDKGTKSRKSGGVRGIVPGIRIKFYRLGSLARYKKIGRALHFKEISREDPHTYMGK